MNFRRFVYLVTRDRKWRDYPLYRIDMARLFLPPKGDRDRPPTLNSLPSPTLRFRPPMSEYYNGSMGFVLHDRGGGGATPQMVGTDQTGRAVMCNPEMGSVHALPSLVAPKYKPISFTVGNDLYILDTFFNFHGNGGGCYHCFDDLVFREDRSARSHDDWYCHALPPPPYVHDYNIQPYTGTQVGRGVSSSPHVGSHALVGGGGGGGSSIWISKKAMGTHSFDVATGVWTKAGGWALPFSGRAHYLPEHNLWIGVSDDDDASLCASDLTAATAPEPIHLWRDDTQPEWTTRSSHLVHLGGSRFFLARVFEINHPAPPDDLRSLKYAVFSGIEVRRCGEELRVVKHMSDQYRLFHKLMHWVL